MSKKLLATDYTIDADSDKITVKGFYRAEQFQLITDVTPDTGGTIIYNFADGTKGHKSVTFDTIAEETTIQLEQDLSALGIDSTSNLQIIVDHPETEIEVSDSLLDPVHKIRVSTPENLIDTDFEYGLQPTKWETLELSNNVPSFFVADGDTAIPTVRAIKAIDGSDLIKVECTDQHNLVVGTPIDVSGLDARTAEGKFLIVQADSNNFYYRANAPQTVTGEIGSLYSAVTPGSFYAGSQIRYSQDSGLETDELDPSRITINTEDVHGFVENSNFYLVNTVASKALKVKDNKTAPDDSPFVDKRDTLATVLDLDLSKTKTNALRGRWSAFFGSDAVDTSTNRITWTGHSLRTNYTLIYVPPSGADEIGGLQRFQVYYVRYVDANTIELASTYNGSAINFTTTGDTTRGQHSLHLIYEIRRSYAPYRNSWCYHYPWAYYTGGSNSNNSGSDLWTGYGDLSGNSWYGLGAGPADGCMVMTRNYAYPANSARWMSYYLPEYQNSRNIYGNNHHLYTDFPEYDNGTPTDHPSRWNPIEDFGRWSGFNWNRNAYWRNEYRYWRFQKYYYHGTYNYYWANGRIFIFPFIFDEESDTFFAENHGMETGQTATFTTVSGSAPTFNQGTASLASTVANTNLADGDYTVEVASPDRFKLDTTGRMQTALADSNGGYKIEANTANPTANSFYVENHGLIDGQELTLGTEGSPTIPSVPTGALAPKWKDNSNSNAVDFAGHVNDFLNTHITGLSGHQDFTTSNHNGNSQTLVNYPFSSFGGTQPIYYVNTWYTNSYTEVYRNNSRLFYAYPSSTDLYLGNINLTNPRNVFHSTSNRSYGIFRLGTPWQQNAAIPFYFDLTFADRASRGNPGDGVSDTTSWWRFDNYSYQRILNANPSGGVYDRNTGTHTGATTGHVYHYGLSMTKHERSHEWVQINLAFGKRTQSQGWTPYGNGSFNNDRYGNSTYDVHYMSGRMSDEVQMRLWFGGSSSLGWSNAKTLTLVRGLIDHIDQNFNNPTFADGDELTAVVVNNNRFSFNNLDLTDSGDGINDSNFLTFSLTEVQGAADGSYAADSIGDTFLKLTTPFEIKGNEETLNSDEIDSDYNIPIEGGHPYLSGTKVVYTNTNSDSDLSYLTSGNEYYLFAVDNNHIQLMDNLQDALVGSNPLPIDADSAGAIHKVKTTSIAGRTKAEGTVTLDTSKKKVVGDQTLFKRFFKAGDTIFFRSATTGDSVARLYEHEIAVISDDENMELTTAPNIDGSTLEHYVKTNVYVKPDGYSVHRPFDGGVEIGAGTAPLSQITRQTRKYFRYQSGKGIQTSLAINFNPPVVLETINSNGTTVRCKTKYPHRLSTGMQITVSGASDGDYNGTFDIASVTDDYNFTYTADNAPNASIPGGIVQYVVNGYSGSFVRAGMFDNQNGFFFEWDGGVLHCVRRSSTTQLSGTVNASKNSGLIEGINTNFSGQLNKNDKIVIRGQTYKVVRIDSRTKMYVQPQYRGISSDGIILTKTEDVRIPQTNWNLDKCDGSGKQGFIIDTSKIQMAYMDYSWYGAGKIRFGFKDRRGHVRYVHEFVHNNRLDEAYMRSGNLPAKYEIENDENPTYAPTLFHWGTSVIMDGTFDDDKAFLFTAPSKNLSFTNGQANTATTAANSSLIYRWNRSQRRYDWYVRIPFATSQADKFSTGTKLYTSDEALNGDEVSYTDYSSSQFRVHIYITSGYSAPGGYPSITSGTTVNIGQPATGGDDLQLGTDVIPLVSLRLAPSVDNNLTGDLGERDIINRMQLKLAEVGMILTHDCEVKLILNGDISTVAWENVKAPSLSQLIKHEQGDQVTGGNEVFSFRASGGTDGASNASNFSLGDIIDMGNSILGGNGIFPNGPDILTVAVQVVDTSGINATTPFTASSRITWSESQA